MKRALETDSVIGRGAFISWRWLGLGFLLIAVVSLGLTLYFKSGGSPIQRGTNALVEAFSKRRLIEPRLSGGFKAAEFKSSTENASGIGTEDLQRARTAIEDAVAGGDPGSDLAYARLVLSSKEEPAEAYKHLRRALAREPDNAEVHNDLGVCLIEQSKLEDAVEEFDAALEKSPDMPEALFNRGLCFQRLLLRDAAYQDCERLLKLESQTGWAREIGERKEMVSAPLAPAKRVAEVVAALNSAFDSGNLEEARIIAQQNMEIAIKEASLEGPLQYLKEAIAGNTERAEQLLSRTEFIGEQFKEFRGDTSVADFARYLRSLPKDQRESEIALLTDYVKAEHQFFLQKYSDAKPEFERLAKEFANRGNRLFYFFSIFCEAGCDFAAGALQSSLKLYNEALTICGTSQWPYREATDIMQLGIVQSRLGHDSAGIKYCERALKLGEGMRFLQAKALQFLASAYVNIGNLDKALSCLRESTRLDLTSVPSLKNISNNYLNIAELYRIRGNHPLALLYAKQSLNFAEQDGDSNRAAQASAFTAVEHAQFEQADEAERQLQAAFRYLNGADKGQRAYTESFVLARAGEIAAHRTEAWRAIEYYTKVLNLLENSEGDRIGLIEARRGRAEAYSQAREFKKAWADLEHAIKLIEGYREGIEERDERSNFLDASQAVFDQLILLNQGALARHAEAFDFSEQSRARTLLDEFSLARGADTFSSAQHREKPLKLSEVQRALPPDLRLLAYSVTSERTYMFLVTRDGMEVAESPVTTEILDRLVQEYVSEIRSKGDEVSAKGKALYRYLIAPVKKQLADGKKLCIVPDKALHFLPFASLVDEDGKYLLYYHLSYAPSASTLVRCIEEDQAKGTSKDEKILAVGNPRFNREQFPLLPNLQDAEGEAIESAALYPQKVVLNGADATEARVIAALRDCDVAHLAVHCLVEEKSPWLAALVLAGSDQATEISAPQSSVASPRTSIDDGLLYLNEVYDFTLPRTRLVVISACESGLGQYYRGEGMVSLVRPFLALRVPMVVASLWSIDSKATSDLMTNFHRNRMAANHPLQAGEALRLAQITMAESAQYQHPFYWAPFIAVGSNN